MRKRPDNTLRNKSEAQRIAVSNSHKDGRHILAYKKISISMKDNTNGCGSKHPHTAETIEKIKQNTPIKRGKNHPMWKGGVSHSRPETTEYKNWRRYIFERDNYTCQCCKQRGRAIQAHHIERWIDRLDLRLDSSNGITLCVACHKFIKQKHFQLGFQLP